jgi:hypothetical protein
MNDPILRLVVLHMVKSGHISKSAISWRSIGRAAGKLWGHMTGTEARLSKVVPELERALTNANVPKETANVLTPHLDELAGILREHGMTLEGPLADEVINLLAERAGVQAPTRVKLSPAAINELRRQIPMSEKATNLGSNLAKGIALLGGLAGTGWTGVEAYRYLTNRGSTSVVPYKDTHSKPLPVPQPATEQPSTETVTPPVRPGLSHRQFTFGGADARPASEYQGFTSEFNDAPPQK